MPGNELGDRVHNFFAQDNSLQEQHQSHVLEGNWPVHNNNFWVGSQRQIDVLNSSKSFSSQNSELDRGQPSYPVQAAHGLNFSQSNLRPDFSRNQSLNEQQYSNGFMYGNQFYETRQTEANFLAVETDSDQRHLMASRGLLVHELQQGSGHEPQAKASDRSGTSIPPVSFDLFGGQQQMSHQQASMLQPLQRQQSGFNDMQQLQQQLMIRKMQELQRQQQRQQLDLRHQNLINQVNPLTKQASGSPSSLVNGTPNSDAVRYPWTAEPNANWLSRGSSAMQGSPSGVAFTPNLGQTQRLMDLVPQQVDHSLYGVPVSNSRGLSVNHFSQMMTERSSIPQLATSSNSFQGNQHSFLPGRISGQEGTSVSRQKFHNENSEHTSSQILNIGMADMGFLQQVNSLPKDATQQDFAGRQDLAAQSGTSHERPRMQVSSPQDEVTLDPTEEKILYGSDDNIWSAFGKNPNISSEAGNLFDTGGLSNGFQSLQSGSWSALMQSAVAETSSNDIGSQEEWSGLIFPNTDGSTTNQLPAVHNENVKRASLPNDSVRNPSALGSGSVPPSNIITPNPMGLNQLGHIFQNEPGERVPTDISQRLGQSSEEARKWSKHSSVQNSVAEGSQIHGNASQTPGHCGTRPQPNGWIAQAAMPPGGDRVLNIHEAEKELQNSRNNQVKLMRGEPVHGSSLWKSSSVTSSSIEMGPLRSMSGNGQANSFDVGAGDGASLVVQNNHLFNQWKNASPSAKFQGGDSLGRMKDQVNEQNQGMLSSFDKEEVPRHDRENSTMQENSNDSHHSNLSRHASGGFKESGLSDGSDSRCLSSGKQKSTNQLANKVSVPRKFQYHPMGNLDENVEPTHGMKQPTQVHAISLQNAHFGQSKLFGQVSKNSAEKGELPKDYKGPDKEASSGSFSGFATSTSVPFSLPFDSYTNKASSPSQNMLELLHKVDQSKDHGSAVHLGSSECNVSSQVPEAEKNDGSAGRLQHSQSSFSRGFGLQLGPPSQLLQNNDLPSPPQNAQGMVNSKHTSHAGTEMGERGLLVVPTSSVQSLPSSNEEPQIQYQNYRSAGPGHRGNDSSLYKAPGNYHPAFTSDTPYSRNQLQNKQIIGVSGKVAMNQHIDSSFSCNTSHSMQRGSAETVPPDSSGNLQKDKLASSVGMAEHTGPYDVQGVGPGGTASTRDEMHVSQHFGLPGISRQGASSQLLHNVWTNIPAAQNTLAAQYPKAPSHFSELPHPNIVESSMQGDLGIFKGGHITSKASAIHADSPVGIDGEGHRLKESSGKLASFVNDVSAQKMEVPLGRASPANSATRQEEIEAFGRSLKPNIFSNEKFALLNQLRVLKDAENDPSNSFSKRIKGPDNILDGRQGNLMAGKQNEDNVGDSLGSSSGVPSEDSRMLSFSAPPDTLQGNTLPHGNAAPEDIVVAGLHDSQSNSINNYTAVRAEHHPVSPQMAPSWFNHYGSFKNGQMFPMHNAHKVNVRPEESPFSLAKSSTALDASNLEDNSTAAPVDACPAGSTRLNSAPMSEANEHLSSPQSLQLNVTGQHQVILRPKKRKSATSELRPWHKQISDGSQSLSILSVAEADWSKAANRLMEKVEDDVELIEDGPPLLRSKRRLILTTQLMQQLFSPPPATILSADANSKYECVAYAVSRVVLGDTCNALSSSSNPGLPCDGMDLHANKGKLDGDPRFAKVIEALLGKARKLENDFLRLDKSAPILDLRLEGQDLEKFSIINRFAKFHGRGQTDNAETSSSDTTASTHRPLVQRYVTALPMPRSLPDRVQCLSL